MLEKKKKPRISYGYHAKRMQNNVLPQCVCIYVCVCVCVCMCLFLGVFINNFFFYKAHFSLQSFFITVINF